LSSEKRAEKDTSHKVSPISHPTQPAPARNPLSLHQKLKAFWIPSKAPEAKASKEKPDGSTQCPASGKKLRLKDLVDVKFTPVPEGETGRYMDPITKDTFGNTSKLVVLATTGAAVRLCGGLACVGVVLWVWGPLGESPETSLCCRPHTSSC